MDGLECSEILLSEISVDNEKSRFDSDFFQKKFISAYKKIKTRCHSTIGEEIDTLTDFHSNGSYESIAAVFKLLDEPDYAYMVRTTDLKKKDYYNDVKYVSEQTYQFLGKSKVFGGEVIINKIGSPGETFLMPDLHRPVSLGMNQFMLKMKNTGRIDNALLFVFLNTNLGKLLIERKINGTVPLTIDKDAIRSIYVPCFNSTFRKYIYRIIQLSDSFYEKANVIYAEAEKLFETEIGINMMSFSNGGISTKSFSESFDRTGRLDAEYYQPKYDDLISIIKKFSYRELKDIVTIKKSIEPGSEAYKDKGIPFVRVSDICKFGISDTDKFLENGGEFDKSDYYLKKDEILFSKDGSVGIAYKVEEDLKYITSSALLHLIVNDKIKILPDYLTLVLNSKVVQLQAERDAGGSIIKHWKPSEIEEVLIPLLDSESQRKISDKVSQSFDLREKSSTLFDCAKLAVELVIEENEESAISWLKEKTSLIMRDQSSLFEEVL